MVDCYVASQIIKWTEILYISARCGKNIFGDVYDAAEVKRFMSDCKYDTNMLNSNIDKVFMPYVKHAHWKWVIIDLKENTINHVDPNNYDNDYKYVIERLEKISSDIIEESFLNIFKEKVFRPANPLTERPTQEDNYNCALYLIHCMDCIGQNVPFDKTLNEEKIKRFRSEVALELLHKSENMSEQCSLCFFSHHLKEVITCHMCNRIPDLLCLCSDYEEIDFENFKKENCIYVCFLCEQGKQAWMDNWKDIKKYIFWKKLNENCKYFLIIGRKSY